MTNFQEYSADDYIRVANIYGFKATSEKDLVLISEEKKRQFRYPTLELGLLKYLEDNLNTPIEYIPEILKLNRKLSSIEIRILKEDRTSGHSLKSDFIKLLSDPLSD